MLQVRTKAVPHGGERLFHQKSTCFTQFTSGPCVMQTWSHNTPDFGPNETCVGFPANEFAVWRLTGSTHDAQTHGRRTRWGVARLSSFWQACQDSYTLGAKNFSSSQASVSTRLNVESNLRPLHRALIIRNRALIGPLKGFQIDFNS